MSKRINIILPDETAGLLDRLTTTGTRSAFISRAVLHYIQAQSRQPLRKALREGYLANSERSLEIAAEWFPLEEEAALKADLPKTSHRPKAKRG